MARISSAEIVANRVSAFVCPACHQNTRVETTFDIRSYQYIVWMRCGCGIQEHRFDRYELERHEFISTNIADLMHSQAVRWIPDPRAPQDTLPPMLLPDRPEEKLKEPEASVFRSRRIRLRKGEKE